MINIYNPKNVQKTINTPFNLFTQKSKEYENLEKYEYDINILDMYPNIKIEANDINIEIIEEQVNETNYDNEIFKKVKNFIQRLDFENKIYQLHELKYFAKDIKNQYQLRNININVSKSMLINLFKDIIENPSMYIPEWVYIGDGTDESVIKIDIAKIKEKTGYLVKELKQIIKEINEKHTDQTIDIIPIHGNRENLYNSIEKYINNVTK